MKAIGTAKTSSTGTYGGVLTRLKTTKKPYFLYFRSRVTAADRDVTSAGCAGTSLAPAGCVSATQAGFSIFSRTIIRVRITR
jgi:hypothetical protein